MRVLMAQIARASGAQRTANVTITVILEATLRYAKVAEVHGSAQMRSSENYQYPAPSSLSTYEEPISLTTEHSSTLN